MIRATKEIRSSAWKKTQVATSKWWLKWERTYMKKSLLERQNPENEGSN